MREFRGDARGDGMGLTVGGSTNGAELIMRRERESEKGDVERARHLDSHGSSPGSQLQNMQPDSRQMHSPRSAASQHNKVVAMEWNMPHLLEFCTVQSTLLSFLSFVPHVPPPLPAVLPTH